MSIVVVGGTVNCGARIVRALRADPSIELMVAGRRIVSVPAAEDVPGVLVDIDEASFAQGLKALSPGLALSLNRFAGTMRISSDNLRSTTRSLKSCDAPLASIIAPCCPPYLFSIC